MTVPSDIALTLATASYHHEGDGGWFGADEVAVRLQKLGFDELKAQNVSPMLRRLTRMEAPPVEVRTARFGGYCEFRLTTCGRTWLFNLIPWTRAWR